MAWFILLISAVFEAVWATSLGMSEGFTRTGPTVAFLITLTISMIGLGWAAKTIPIGTAYAVWTGVGAALTVIYAMLTGTEPASPIRIVLIAGIILAVVGLNLAPSVPPTHDGEEHVPTGARPPVAD
ncbi:DMT family transporter [Pseudactinotalea sp. Z1739]|uniref:DMT family transporter n=1 Tax=Pseudactinotalea sp. Z1739 TaxID=3413028 RepID=UPI003C7E0721